ncbi:adhesion G-protein coupled receptor G2-like [Apostichopus japonicus]|uniref:adhesion G-protein coupled receptor G2-like n=1 Tax=Stichopus japonicus TaxID=307972 RepID=UPI003AB496DD
MFTSTAVRIVLPGIVLMTVVSSGLECYLCEGVRNCSLPLNQLTTTACSDGLVCSVVNVTVISGPGFTMQDKYLVRGCIFPIKEDNCLNSTDVLNQYVPTLVPDISQITLDSESFVCFCGTNLCNEQLTPVSLNKPAEDLETILSGIAYDTGGDNRTDEEVKVSADAVQEATSDGEFLDEDSDRVELTVSALESVVGRGVSSIEVTESVIRAVNNLIEVDGDVRDHVIAVGGRLVEALEKQLRNFQQNEGNFSQIYGNIGVVSINVVPSNVGGSLTFAHVLEDGSRRNVTGGLKGGTNEIYGDARDVPLEQVITSISVPAKVLKLLDGTADVEVPISFVIYDSDTLFTPSKPTRRKRATERIVSHIISTIQDDDHDKDDDEDNGDDIDNPVEYPIISQFFTLENLNETEEKLDSSCVVWLYNEDTDEGFWSDESCDMLSDDSDLTVCSCKHIGSFAVLIRVGPLEPEIALYYITFIGSIISGVCLIFCIVAFLSIKSLRSKHPTQIHINLCLSLLGFYVAFLASPLAVGKKQQCAAVSAIIQFFCLATLAWMSAEALNMYYLFLKATKGSIRYFTPISCMVVYGSSLTCAILVAFLDRSTDYVSANYCFIHPGYALYFGFLAEVGAMFVFNLIIFVMVIRKVLCRPVMVSKAKEHAKRNEIIIRIRHGVLFWFVLGLSWVFGFLAAVDQSTLIFDYLYCICIALQGFLMFLLLCVANPDFRKRFSVQTRSESSQSNGTSKLRSPSTVKSTSETNQSEISGNKNIIKTSTC